MTEATFSLCVVAASDSVVLCVVSQLDQSVRDLLITRIVDNDYGPIYRYRLSHREHCRIIFLHSMLSLSLLLSRHELLSVFESSHEKKKRKTGYVKTLLTCIIMLN